MARSKSNPRRTSSKSSSVDKFAKFFLWLTGQPLEDFQRVIVGEVLEGRRTLFVLIPRGNGKTTLMAALALWHLLTTEHPEVYVAASTTDQAAIAYEAIEGWVKEHPELGKRLKMQPGYKSAKFIDRPGKLKVLSSDAGGAWGFRNMTLALVDELHAHRDGKLYTALKTAMGKRAEAQIVTISTAGYDEDGVLGQVRKTAMALEDVKVAGTLTVCRNPASDFALYEWACREDDDLTDAEVVKAANPASFVSLSFLREQLASPDLPFFEFCRYHGNVWTLAAESWLPTGAWAACGESGAEIPDGAQVFLGVDIGRKQDRTAIAVLHQRDDERWVVRADIFTPPTDGTSLELSTVEQAIRDLAGRYRVNGVVYDPWSFERSAQMLSDEGLLMIEHPMSNERMVKASALIYEAIVSQNIVHDGDHVLAAHVAAGSQKDTERGWRLAKNPKLKRPIDALIAMTLAFGVAAKHSGPSVYERRGLVVL